MNNVFVLYDRNTDSVWYPLNDNSFDAVSGPYKGQSLPFLEEPPVMRLHEWAALHPETLVLLPPPPSARELERRARRDRAIERISGTWAMKSDTGQQVIEAEMRITFNSEGFEVVWISQGQEMAGSEVRYNGTDLKFTREMPTGDVIDFDGTLAEDGTLAGVWKFGDREIPCSGVKIKPKRETPSPAAQALLNRVTGTWDMVTEFRGDQIEATLELEVIEGVLGGTWTSNGLDMELYDVSYDGRTLRFKRTMGGRGELVFEGVIEEGRLVGAFEGEFGSLKSSGSRAGLH